MCFANPPTSPHRATFASITTIVRNRSNGRFAVDGVWTEVSVAARHIGANNGEVLRDAAIAGLGIAVLPTFIAGDALAAGTLKIVLGDYEGG